MSRAALAIATLLSLHVANVASAARPAVTTGLQTLSLQGRTVDIYVPERRAARAPLVLAFHWSTARGKNMLSLWKATADAEGIVLVLPSSRHRRTWTHADSHAVDEAMTTVLATGSIDRSRIYVTGFSGGANFAYRYFVTHPKLFAGLGPFAGRLNATDDELSVFKTSAVSKRACIVHGTLDRKIPFSEARRAVRELGARGFDVRLETLQQGHWPSPNYATPMWQCLDGDSDLRRS